MDLNYIKFINADYEYCIFDTYYAIENSMTIGIEIRNTTSNKVSYIKGIKSAQKGSLIGFRYNELLEVHDAFDGD
ncbi:hypothetical protein [Flavobacterium sp. J27]|uniref:hypothetical protein n=1 Tax=Flavobacterium sp. J27 TaxID=2060419 RepID=UPI00102F7BD4|nr:hypothetical protein [Flavobacterium sp. J27]